MKTLAKLLGRRVGKPGEKPSEWLPGDYWKDTSDDTWHGVTPDGGLAWFKNHHVEEHEDGTISIVQGPWGSNSILCSGGNVIDGTVTTWHGCIDRGVWKEF
jgi:hypothetical protein